MRFILRATQFSFLKLSKTLIQSRLPQCQCHARYSTTTLKESPSVLKNFEEIKIEVPWGHIAGKWYGPKHVRPLVGLHGWQDNAGTFDTLAPLLPPGISFLCLDLPGHGKSSWLPEGISYHSIDYVILLQRIMDNYKWDKISLLGHSMSSINTFVYSALFPDKVDMLIGLDILKPLTRSAESIVDNFSTRIASIIKWELRIHGQTEPPTYEWDELVERLYLGTNKSVYKDCCKYLLERNIKPSQNEANKYFFSRDNRLKMSLFYALPQAVNLEMARRIKCPHLFIKALQAPFYERKEYFDETLKVLKQNPNFEYYEVDGTHHVHLNEPEKISQIVNPFINKWRS